MATPLKRYGSSIPIPRGWHHLPTALWHNIYSFLSLENFFSSLRTCRQLTRIASSPTFFTERFRLRSFPTLLDLKIAICLLNVDLRFYAKLHKRAPHSNPFVEYDLLCEEMRRGLRASLQERFPPHHSLTLGYLIEQQAPLPLSRFICQGLTINSSTLCHTLLGGRVADCQELLTHVATYSPQAQTQMLQPVLDWPLQSVRANDLEALPMVELFAAQGAPMTNSLYHLFKASASYRRLPLAIKDFLVAKNAPFTTEALYELMKKRVPEIDLVKMIDFFIGQGRRVEGDFFKRAFQDPAFVGAEPNFVILLKNMRCQVDEECIRIAIMRQDYSPATMRDFSLILPLLLSQAQRVFDSSLLKLCFDDRRPVPRSWLTSLSKIKPTQELLEAFIPYLEDELTPELERESYFTLEEFIKWFAKGGFTVARPPSRDSQ